jgi:porin
MSDTLKNTLKPVFNLQDESGVEIFYNLAVREWFRVAADVQFLTPASGDAPDAIYVGLSTYFKF